MLGKRVYVTTTGESCIPPGMLVVGTLLEEWSLLFTVLCPQGRWRLRVMGILLMAPCKTVPSFLLSSAIFSECDPSLSHVLHCQTQLSLKCLEPHGWGPAMHLPMYLLSAVLLV